MGEMREWEFKASADTPSLGVVRWSLPQELAEDLARLPEDEQQAMRRMSDFIIDQTMRLLIGVIYSRDRAVLEQFLIFTSELADHHLRQVEAGEPNLFEHWEYVHEAAGALLWTPDAITQRRLSNSSDQNREGMKQLMQHLLGQFAHLIVTIISSKKRDDLLLEHQNWTQEFQERVAKTLT